MNRTAIILAGGKSQRFGKDKTIIKLNGERVIETIAKKCAGVFDEVLIAGSSGKFDIAYAREIPDIYKDMGPLAGIHGGLSASANEVCFVTACDLPFFHPPFALRLLDEINDCDIVVPKDGNEIQPLFAVYRKSILPLAERLLETNKYSVRELYNLTRVKYISADSIKGMNIFYNINFMTDYNKIKGDNEMEAKFAVPTISVVGYSDSGKTTYLEKLIPALKKRGVRLCVVKHDAHSFDIDIPGKDSWRLAQAGADIVMISSPSKLAAIEKWQEQESLPQLSERLIGKADLILTEGFKRGSARKIEVRRAAVAHEPMCDPTELFAIASDYEPNDEPGVQWLHLDDADTMADLIMKLLREDSL